MITIKDVRNLCELVNGTKTMRGEYKLRIQRRNGYVAIDEEYRDGAINRTLLCGTTKECYYFLKGIFYEL